MDLKKDELIKRRNLFTARLDTDLPEWDSCIIITKINQYYFTGTMQDGFILMKRDGTFSYFVRQSYQRAVSESPLDEIYPIKSYRDAAAKDGSFLGNALFETGSVPYAVIERLHGYFDINKISSAEKTISRIRSVKSEYELYWMKKSGEMHEKLLTEQVPSMLREGMSEAQLYGNLLGKMTELGYHGISRFEKFQTEIQLGQIGFGSNSLVPTSFDGPGGSRGNSPAVPLGGDPDRLLKKGDLVFVDLGFGISGYHSDKTQVYSFGADPSDEALSAHAFCLRIQGKLTRSIRPGAVPSEIYSEIMSSVTEEENKNFMGFQSHKVKFLGHGVGLAIDESPVIAAGFNDPIEKNMVFACEPKKGVENQGMTGVEDTFAVTDTGCECITGSSKQIITV